MGRSTKGTLTYHESYGVVSTAQLRAYRRHNVSPSDHRDLEDRYGTDHEAITAAVKNPAHHSPNSESFSAFAFWNSPRTDGW